MVIYDGGNVVINSQELGISWIKVYTFLQDSVRPLKNKFKIDNNDWISCNLS